VTRIQPGRYRQVTVLVDAQTYLLQRQGRLRSAAQRGHLDLGSGVFGLEAQPGVQLPAREVVALFPQHNALRVGHCGGADLNITKKRIRGAGERLDPGVRVQALQAADHCHPADQRDMADPQADQAV
jgi:hypothetical protein